MAKRPELKHSWTGWISGWAAPPGLSKICALTMQMLADKPERQGAGMIPERLLPILRSCEDDKIACFPSTEVFNETWMQRLVLDAMHSCDVQSYPLSFLPESRWY